MDYSNLTQEELDEINKVKGLNPELTPETAIPMEKKPEENDAFLRAISQVESSGGKNVAHKEMKSGIHAGTSAVGEYGIMPNTSDEMINRLSREGKASDELKALKGKSTEELAKAFIERPDLYKQVVGKLKEHVFRDTDDPRVAAYRWNQGSNLPLTRIPPSALESKDYVKKFTSSYQPSQKADADRETMIMREEQRPISDEMGMSEAAPLGLVGLSAKMLPGMTTADAEILQDIANLSGKDKQLIESELKAARQKALEQTFRQSPAQKAISQAAGEGKLAGKSAVEAAKVFEQAAPSKDFVLKGKPYGGSLAVVKEAGEELAEGGARVPLEKALVAIEQKGEKGVLANLIKKFGVSSVAKALSNPVTRNALKWGGRAGTLGLTVAAEALGATDVASQQEEDRQKRAAIEEGVAIAEKLDSVSPTLSSQGPSLFDRISSATTKAAEKGIIQPGAIPASDSLSDDIADDVADLQLGEELNQLEQDELLQQEKLQRDMPFELLQLAADKESDYNRQLKEARAQRDRELRGIALAENISRMGAGLTAGLSGGIIKPFDVDTKGFETAKAMALKLPEDVKEQMEADKADPKSAVSQSTREFFKSATGVNVPDSLSAASLEKQFPIIQKFLSDQEKRLMAQERIDIRRERLEGTEALRTENLFSRLKDRLTAGGGTVGNQIRQNIINTKRIFNTANIDEDISVEDLNKIDIKKLDDVTRVGVVEMAVEINKLLSGSNVPGQKQLDKLLPNNLMMGKVKVLDFLTSQGNRAQQGAYLKELLKLTARVRDSTKKENYKMLKKYIAGTDTLRERNPEAYKQILEEFQLDRVPELEKEGTTAPSQTKTTAKRSVSKQELEEYVKTHNVKSEKEAAEFLKRSGYSVEGF